MPDNSPCTCPVVWAFTPQAATITPGCPVHGKDAQRQIADGDLKPKELDKPDPAGQEAVLELTQGAFQRIPRRQQGTSA